MYWMIPKTVVRLISAKVIEHSSYFGSQGVVEIDIFPGIKIETKPSNLGPLGFLSAQPVGVIVIYNVHMCMHVRIRT